MKIGQSEWSKRPVQWVNGDTAYISVVFTWQLPQVYSICVAYREQGYRVKAGGVAVKLIPEYLSQVAEYDGEVKALHRHNPQATFTSRGCIRKCGFCAVPKIEGDLVELDDYEVKPIVCDNNLLACSQGHFDKVVDRLKCIRGIDFNQGLDARLLKPHHIDRLRELDLSVLRFAWDDVRQESCVFRAIESVLQVGFPKSKLRCYVLFNYEDTPDDAFYRCNKLKQMGLLPNVQRYQPLDTLQKNSHKSSHWDKTLLADFHRYWARQIYLKPISFEEYQVYRHSNNRSGKPIIPEEQGVLV